MNQNDELFRAAQHSVLVALGCMQEQQEQEEKEQQAPEGNNDDDQAMTENQNQQQQNAKKKKKKKKKNQPLFDVMFPGDFSRESIMFIRYVVDVCGIQVFDLPPNEVQKLWLEFVILFNNGEDLASDWYDSTSVREDSSFRNRLVRADATTWPTLDKTTKHDWKLKLDENQKESMEQAQSLSSELSQTGFRTFFAMAWENK